ncbi:MAG: THUMP domain-containing protein [Candidatus Aenigmatarchaeota archaeon]
MYNSILVGVDEIWLKSEVKRKKLMKILLEDIKKRINTEKIIEKRGRIIIDEYNDEYLEKLKKVFGIKVIYPAIKVKSDIDEISKAALILLENSNLSFKVKTKRVYKGFSKNSLEVNREVGDFIVKNKNLKVDLKKPEKIIYVEIHKEFSFVSDKKIKCLGGLPIGSEGKAIMLFSGGIDSMVASILIGKRGINLDFLFINLGGNVMEYFIVRAFEKIKEYFPYSKLFILDFDFENFFKIREGYRQICFKYLIYKVAEEFSKFNNYKAIVSGESIGQVSSQTFDSLILLENQIEVPILRPLISFNKDEIVELGKKFGLLEFRAPELCQLEKHSNAHPSENILKEEFSKLNIDFRDLIKNIREAKKEELDFSVFIKNYNEDLVVVDIKEADKLNFKSDKGYLIVCSKGILAYHYAKKLREKGINAYALDYKTATRLGYKVEQMSVENNK